MLSLQVVKRHLLASSTHFHQLRPHVPLVDCFTERGIDAGQFSSHIGPRLLATVPFPDSSHLLALGVHLRAASQWLGAVVLQATQSRGLCARWSRSGVDLSHYHSYR